MQSSSGRLEEAGRAASRRERGFTLIELLISFSALLMVLLGFSRMLISSQMASNTTYEATLAKEAARSMIEVLQAGEIEDLYATYNANGGDDPDGPNTASGPGFAVPGLDAPPGDADGLPGRILFPERNGVLSELCEQPQYGWPIDMDCDGEVVSANVSDTYLMLPVLVRVEWRGSAGDGVMEFKTVVWGF